MARPNGKTIIKICEEIVSSDSSRYSTSVSTNTLSHSDIAGGRGFVGRKPKKEITAVLHLPNNAQAIASFEKKICDFYIAQIEKRLHSLPKAQKLEIMQELIESYRAKSKAS